MIFQSPALKDIRRRLLYSGFVVMLGLLLILPGKTHVARADSLPNGITTNGDGTAEQKPDLARISGSVQTQAATAADALDQNSQTLNAVIAALKVLGVADVDISTTGLSVSPIFTQARTSDNTPPPPPTLAGYRASNGITVKTTDLTRVGDLIQSMVNNGINQFNGVQYGLQNPEQLRIMALQAAIDDARAQAQAAADRAGVKLGSILNLTVNGTSAPPVPAQVQAFAAPASASAAAPPPVLPGTLSASTHVTVTFAILGP